MQDIIDFKHFLRTDPYAQAFLSVSHADAPLTLARAPGRLDVMGGVADYSGALVAEMTIAEAALVALAPRTDRTLRVWSLGLGTEFTPQVSLSLDDFYSSGGTLLSYDAVRSFLCRNPQTRWSAYVFGCVYVLLAEGIAAEFPHGANLILDSRVPLGAGVSSSAAVEVAAMQAVSAAYRFSLDGVTLARLCQRVENKVVGAPCGIMDQMSSALCVPNSLLLILCQPHEVQGVQALPEGVTVYGVNSAVKHSVGGSAYTRARIAAFMGRKLLDVDYLASRHPAMLFSDSVPETVLGSEFLKTYGETGDAVTKVDPATIYPIREATFHGVHENHRVEAFTLHLKAAARKECSDREKMLVLLPSAGDLMYESHASYTRIGLGCAETDLLVEMGRAAGPNGGIYGAKITGGGSGGTVAFLTYGDRAAQTIHEIAETYQGQTGLTPQIFEGGLSPGAIAFGSETL